MSAPDIAATVEALRALEAAATPGPWDSEDGESVGHGDQWIAHMSNHNPEHPDYARVAVDAELIAAARNALPALLAVAEEAERLRARLASRDNEVADLDARLAALQTKAAELQLIAVDYARQNTELRDGVAGLVDVRFDCMTASAHSKHQAVPVEHLRALLDEGGE